MSSPAVKRKRSRADLLEADELSPEKDKAPTSAKRQKLDAYKYTPRPKNSLSALGKTIGGFLGLGGRGKEDKDKDELAEDDNNDHEMTNDKGKRDIWEVDTSSPEDTRPRRNGSERLRSALKIESLEKGRNGGSLKKAKTAAPKKPTDDIWDVPDDDPPPARLNKKLTASVERAKALLKPSAQEPESPQKTPARGRPSKSKLLKDAKKIGRQDARERITAAAENSEHEEEGKEEISTPAKRKRDRAEKTRLAERLLVSGSGTRKRGRPRKDEVDRFDSSHLPKGILTPTKGRTPTAKKSVVFEKMTEVDLGFKDIDPTSTKKAKAKGFHETEPAEDDESGSELEHPSSPAVEDTLNPEEDVDSDESDDIACKICGGLKSVKKNEIVMCDGCDFAVHQKCYNLEEIPEGDWFCKDCNPDVKGDISPQLDAALDLPEIDGFAGHLVQMQRTLLDRLTGQKRIKFCGHEEEMQKVHQIVEQTVLAGEGNSILIIGARGCGKTTLVESVITDISSDHREDFHTVRLNGFIHTDDKLALKEIWRQLGREMEVEEDPSNKTSNYADTLASLLALLSYPSELSETSSGQTTKSVIFVLDEFDLFTTHPRQTLLYNLFDIAQSKKAPIAVLGLTTRIDVMESLEKRVKSRFSHRYVHLSLPRSLPAYWEICKQGLVVDADEAESEGFDGSSGQDDFLTFWNTTIEELYENDTAFKHHLQSHFYRTKSVPAFFSSCILPIASLSLKKFKLDGRAFASDTLSVSPPDSKLQSLQGLSELELALLIAAARLDIILDTDTCNFAMAYDEYSSLTSRHKIQTSSSGVNALGSSAKVWGRDVALGAWERLADYELLVPAGLGAGVKDSGIAGRMWKVDVGLEEITGSVDCISAVMAKWCREI